MRSRPAVSPPLKSGAVFAPGGNFNGGPGRSRSARGLRRAVIRPLRESGISKGGFWAVMCGGIGAMDVGGGCGSRMLLRRGSTVLRKWVKMLGTSLAFMERSSLDHGLALIPIPQGCIYR